MNKKSELYINPVNQTLTLDAHEQRQVMLCFTQAPPDPVDISIELAHPGSSLEVLGIIVLDGNES